MAAEDTDSDDSSSTPIGPPGGGPLIFLPVQQSQTSPNDANHDTKSDSDSNSDDSSASTPSGVPGGGFNDLTFLPVDPQPQTEDNDACASSSSSSSSSSSPIGVPGGGANLTFLPIVNTNAKYLHSGSYSDDDAASSDNSSPSPPKISCAKTDTKPKLKKAKQKQKKKKKKHEKKKKAIVHCRSDDEDRKYDDDRWDLVYMTSSPLVVETESDLLPLELLDVSRETEEIMSVLSGATRSNSLSRDLRVVHCIATTGNLIAAMTHRCHILHYSGHGFPGYLAFEDENSIGDTHMLRDIAFKKMCGAAGNKLEFVFTSACHSESVGLSFVAAGVPHVVSIDTKFEVSDEGAMTFTKYFYEALLCGRTISDSFNLAKQSVEFISSSAKRDFEKFKLLPEGAGKGYHDVRLFYNNNNDNKLYKVMNRTPQTPPNNLPATIQPFIGRSVEMREIIHAFMAKKNENYRILNIFGDSGVGKSAIAIMVARYLNDRKMYFRNGIFYIDCMKLISHSLTFTEMMNSVLSSHFQRVSNTRDTFELISNLSRFCRYALFIVDDIDQLMLYYRESECDVNKQLLSVIFQILVQVSEKIKFILISKKKISGDILSEFDLNSTISPRPYHLRRLSSSSSAKLFAKLCGSSSWRPSDIKENIDIMSILKNNAFNIHNLAALKNEWECATLTKLVETYKFKSELQRKTANNKLLLLEERKRNREQLIRAHISNVAAQQVWRKAHGMEQCDYHKIFEILKYDFTEYTFSKRQLEQNNLMQCFRTLGMNHDLTIAIDKFDAIYLWFNGLTRLVQILSQYYNRLNPVVIHGFVSREDAHKMLLSSNYPCGTFLIRFRYKEAKSIAISYKQSSQRVSNLKCDLSRDPSHCDSFICGKKLLPLAKFILSFPVLKYLYVDNKPYAIPKEEIFSNDTSVTATMQQKTHSWHPPRAPNNDNVPRIKQYAPTQNIHHNHRQQHY